MFLIASLLAILLLCFLMYLIFLYTSLSTSAHIYNITEKSKLKNYNETMLSVLSVFAVWIIAFYLAGLKEWSVFGLMVLAALGLGEYYAIKKTGITLSERFYRKAKENKLVGILLTAVMLGGFLVILYHLWTLF